MGLKPLTVKDIVDRAVKDAKADAAFALTENAPT